MKQGEKRFKDYLVKLETLLAQAGEEKNPALWLYQNDVRTCLFMLESLGRLYSKITGKKVFKNINDSAKKMEDLFGVVDYYDGFKNNFAVNTSAPITVTAWLSGQMENNIQQLNHLLIKEKWLGKKANKTKKFRKKLEKTKWLKQKKDTESLKNIYEQEIEEILMFASETNNGFTKLEGQVHEMRRKLRWLSIYSKSLNGLIQLSDSQLLPDASINFYLTEEIINSPFNIMPEPGDNKYAIVLERNYYLALSWVIAKLGIIKDEALEVFALTEALQATENLPAINANEISIQLLHLNENYLQDILSEASVVVKNYVDKKYLENLVIGISKIKN